MVEQSHVMEEDSIGSLEMNCQQNVGFFSTSGRRQTYSFSVKEAGWCFLSRKRTMMAQCSHEEKIMKKMMLVCLLGLLMSSSVFAHTSISFSVNQGMPGMMDDYGYEDRLLMQQLRARRMQNRMMRMQLAQMGYPRYIRILEPMYSNYYNYDAEPYFVRTRTIYTKQYVRQRQTHCHKRACVRRR